MFIGVDDCAARSLLRAEETEEMNSSEIKTVNNNKCEKEKTNNNECGKEAYLNDMPKKNLGGKS